MKSGKDGRERVIREGKGKSKKGRAKSIEGIWTAMQSDKRAVESNPPPIMCVPTCQILNVSIRFNH